ncbi:MAG: tetratricopeptide repeat protein [Phycisphaeraceae bacterium]|nr:MAG: tetratricopeptide repeat protein [Phycisphaeraceae bacterium]
MTTQPANTPTPTPPTHRSSPVLTALAALALVGVTAGAIYYTVRGTGHPGPQGSPQSKPGGPLSRDDLDKILAGAAELYKRGEAPAAEAVLTDAIHNNPEHQDLYIMLAQVMTGRDNSAAYGHWERAIERAQAAGQTGKELAAVHYQAGNLAMILARLDRAEEHYAQAQGLDKTDPDYPQALAQVYKKQSKWPEAAAQVTLSVTLAPDRAKGWADLAEIELQRRGGSPALAAQHATKARALEPTRTPWRLIEARALNRGGKPADALAVLGGVSEAERYQLPVLRLMGESYGLLSRPEDAAELFARASDAVPQDPEIAFDAAVWAERAKQPAPAARFASRAAALGHPAGKAMHERLTAHADER